MEKKIFTYRSKGTNSISIDHLLPCAAAQYLIYIPYGIYMSEGCLFEAKIGAFFGICVLICHFMFIYNNISTIPPALIK